MVLTLGFFIGVLFGHAIARMRRGERLDPTVCILCGWGIGAAFTQMFLI